MSLANDESFRARAILLGWMAQGCLSGMLIVLGEFTLVNQLSVYIDAVITGCSYLLCVAPNIPSNQSLLKCDLSLYRTDGTDTRTFTHPGWSSPSCFSIQQQQSWPTVQYGTPSQLQILQRTLEFDCL